MVKQDLLAQQAPLVSAVRVDPKELKEVVVNQELVEKLDHLDLLANVESVVRLAHRDQVDHLDLLDQEENVERVALLAHAASLELTDRLDGPVSVDNQDLPDKLDPLDPQ